MSEAEFDRPRRHRPGAPKTRFVASRFNVCSHDLMRDFDPLMTTQRHEILDDQTRKQFLTKSPGYNPFGDDETPLKFNDFDIFTKVHLGAYPISPTNTEADGCAPDRFEFCNN